MRYLHKLSAILFYLLGSSVFLFYILAKNEIATNFSVTWLENVDLPLLAVGILYGVLSIVLGMHRDGAKSKILMSVLCLIGLIIFAALALLNFWPALPQ